MVPRPWSMRSARPEAVRSRQVRSSPIGQPSRPGFGATASGARCSTTAAGLQDRRLRECAGVSRETQATVCRMKTFNLNSDEWDGTRDREAWRVKGALVGQRIGGELIGATMSEVEPGNRLWPYHTHYLNE